MTWFPGEDLLKKMWETLVDKGVGNSLKPLQIVREGKAQTAVRQHDMIALAQAEQDVADIKAGRKRLMSNGVLVQLQQATAEPGGLLLPAPDNRIEPSFDVARLALAASNNNAANLMREEINVARTIIMAEEVLAHDAGKAPEESVDDDWLFMWRDHVGKVSTEALQRLWASVLAGEVKAPGSFSLRTLEFLRMLSKTEAEEIAKIASFVINDMFIARDMSEILAGRGVTFNTMLTMQELGVITGVESIGMSMTYGSLVGGRFTTAFRSHGKAIIADREGEHKLKIQVYPLTSLGMQVMRLGRFSPDVAYLTEFGKKIAAMGYNVCLVDLINETDDELKYHNVITILA